MKLQVFPGTFSVCKLSSGVALPAWVAKSGFFAITNTSEELSIVCEQSLVPNDVKQETDWHVIKVEGPLDFGLTGILASIANPLAQAKISIFAISTFDTDYILVKATNLEPARIALENAGFVFQS
ncbi:MAG TPA: ACT domain-containing protein [Bdellovibrionales bacterium]|jgi:hypothetical protein|nr:ACT domain-containing protein [Bdellovibrionales bacterium]